MNSTVAKSLFASHSYEEYKKLISDLLTAGRVTGDEQSEALLNYTILNEKRMKRLEKTMVITEDTRVAIESLKNDYIWLVISEGWCGDAAQILPIINSMAMVDSKRIDLRIVLRDENPELMSYFLTNKGKAIPILVMINKATAQVEGYWGPRPKGAVELLSDYKLKFGALDETAKADLQMWYLHDKGVSTQNEIMQILKAVD